MADPAVHPTVPYGQVPGGAPPQGQWGMAPGQQYSVAGGGPQGQQPQPSGFPFAGQPQQNGGTQSYDAYGRPVAPQGQPHPTVPYGEQQGGGAAAPQPGQWGTPIQLNGMQPGAMPQAPRAVTLQDDMILDGPTVPPELRGRPFGQVKAIYTALANDWLTRQRQGGQPQQPSPQNPQPQGGQASGQGQGAGAPRWDWSNPGEAFRSVVREELGTMLQPVLAQSNATGVAQARSVAVQQIPDFQYLEGTIMQHVANLPPEALADPKVWVNAARLARGEMMEMGTYRFTPNQGVQTLNGGVQQLGGPPAGFGQRNGGNSPFTSQGPQGQGGFTPPPGGFGTGSPGMPYVPSYQSFTESPSAPMFSEFGGAGLSPAESFVAKEMGMTPDQYLAWRGGMQR
jgi:hypothetical protein